MPSIRSYSHAVTFARRLAPAFVAVAALAVPATSLAQATRTWVSGTGDDANPCSRTAPCKTFQGAILKTAAGGEIDAIDGGGYGAVTITKSITISGTGTQASILSTGVNGVTISAGTGDRVTLDDITINGTNQSPFGTNSSANGVRILQAGTVRLQHDLIMNNGGSGVDFEAQNATGTPQSHLVIEDSTIQGNIGSGVLAIPATTVGERATIINSRIDDNSCGVSAGGTCGATTGTGRPVVASVVNSSVLDNGSVSGATGDGAGIESVGSTAATALSGDQITGNLIGLSKQASGLILSFGNNQIYLNVTNGTPSSGLSPSVKTGDGMWQLVAARAKAEARTTHKKHKKHKKHKRHRKHHKHKQG